MFVEQIGGSLQQTADAWTDQVNATREPEGGQLSPDYISVSSDKKKLKEICRNIQPDMDLDAFKLLQTQECAADLRLNYFLKGKVLKYLTNKYHI